MSDYIKREDLLKRLGIDDLDCERCRYGYNHGFRCERGSDFQDVCEAIEDAEAADVVERKRGKWSRESLAATVGGTYSVVRCSECKAQFPFWETNFCPNCGTDMREK